MKVNMYSQDIVLLEENIPIGVQYTRSTYFLFIIERQNMRVKCYPANLSCFRKMAKESSFAGIVKKFDKICISF